MTDRDPLRELLQEHERATFPDWLRGEEINGVDLVTLDADIVGCVATCVDAPRNLDPARRNVLVQCRSELEQVLPHLTDPAEVTYFASLASMAELALSAR